MRVSWRKSSSGRSPRLRRRDRQASQRAESSERGHGQTSEFVRFDSGRAGSFDCRGEECWSAGVMERWEPERRWFCNIEKPITPLLHHPITHSLRVAFPGSLLPSLRSGWACNFWLNPNTHAQHKNSTSRQSLCKGAPLSVRGRQIFAAYGDGLYALRAAVDDQKLSRFPCLRAAEELHGHESLAGK